MQTNGEINEELGHTHPSLLQCMWTEELQSAQQQYKRKFHTNNSIAANTLPSGISKFLFYDEGLSFYWKKFFARRNLGRFRVKEVSSWKWKPLRTSFKIDQLNSFTKMKKQGLENFTSSLMNTMKWIRPGRWSTRNDQRPGWRRKSISWFVAIKYDRLGFTSWSFSFSQKILWMHNSGVAANWLILEASIIL